MKILKKIGWVFLFVYLVIIFLPKANLFYFAEKELSKQRIVLNDEKLSDFLGFFKVDGAKVYYDGLHVGDIDDINFIFTIFYNHISLNEANFNDNLRQFIPKEIKNLTVRGTILFPVRLFISGDGDFGEISGHVDLYNKKVKLKLYPQKDFVKRYPAIAQQFKKIKDEYIYETTY